MPDNTYLSWVTHNTKTKWWQDSAAQSELQRGLERGAAGVTTNPPLASLALRKDRTLWAPEIDAVLAQRLAPEPKAEALMRMVVTHTAEKLMPEFERTGGASGFVCAQVNPNRAGDRDSMLAMARRYAQWMPNIAVKLPATAAGMDVLEDCIAEGITVTSTVNFTVPQVVAAAERQRQGIQRAARNGVAPGKCFAVIMIGRLDDYLREIAHDSRAGVSESDIRQAGLAVSKRAYSIYRERGYAAVLLVAALRETYHLTELAGADLVMSISPALQEPLVSREFPREERIDRPVPADVIARLSAMPEFVRAYEPDGMTPAEFLGYGLTQRTLSQFIEAGWRPIENLQ